MSGEIRSDTVIVQEYVDCIRSANERLVEDGVPITEDYCSNLDVNSNSTALNQLSRGGISVLSAQISVDCDRVYAIAQLFDEEDNALAGGR